MKIGSLMKEYIENNDRRSRQIGHSLLPEVFAVQNELPVETASNEWTVINSPDRLQRVYTFKNLSQRGMFLEELQALEERTGHYAKIIVEGLQVTIEVWTHDLERVTELDKEYATSCDDFYKDVSLIRFGEYDQF
tara:strand:- start:635 stop:1039 length:405 start_codon:yes stop_codon:yes gene_type:complete